MIVFNMPFFVDDTIRIRTFLGLLACGAFGIAKKNYPFTLRFLDAFILHAFTISVKLYTLKQKGGAPLMPLQND